MKSYVFHVSIPGTGKTWRKLELTEDQTLFDLHMAIQGAFEFDNDHLFSFFMSGRAWDRRTEYSLPSGVSPWDELMFDDDDGDEVIDLDDIEPLTEEQEEQMLQEMSEMTGMPLEMVRDFVESMAQDLVEDLMLESEGRDVRQVTLGDLKLRKNKKFLYLFDYGDEWRFQVRVHDINKKAPQGEYPRVVEAVGDPPEQYPFYDEDDYDIYDDDDLEDDYDDDHVETMEAPPAPGKIIQLPVGDKLTLELKQQITDRCNAFVEHKLKPRHIIPENANNQYGYKVDLFTKWHGRYFYFCSRYRNPRPDAEEAFYETQFDRLEYEGNGRFHLAYMRPTGRWQEVYQNLTLAQALEIIEEEELFWP